MIRRGYEKQNRPRYHRASNSAVLDGKDHRRAYYEHVREYNRFVRKNGELGIIIAEPINNILCVLTVITATASTIAAAVSSL